MSAATKTPAGADDQGLKEERYSLRAMLAEVAAESQVGSLGSQKMHPKDIRKLFRKKPIAPRAAKN